MGILSRTESVYFFQCDLCGSASGPPGKTKDDAVSSARSAGWNYREVDVRRSIESRYECARVIVCPDCTRNIVRQLCVVPEETAGNEAKG